MLQKAIAPKNEVSNSAAKLADQHATANLERDIHTTIFGHEFSISAFLGKIHLEAFEIPLTLAL